MKVSVIVPVYQAEKTLRRCLDSLLAQTLADMEIVAVDDGSTDGSRAILEEYASRFPEKLRFFSVPNGGQGRARNLGIAQANGAYLGFADSDDWVEPAMYETLLRALEREEAELAVCDMLRCYEDGRRERIVTWREGKPLAAAGSACDKLFCRSLVGDTRFPEGLWYEDFAFSALMLLQARKTVHVPRPLYCYRWGHPSTMNNRNAIRNRDLLHIMELLRQPLQAAGRDADFQALVLDHVLLDGVNRLRRQNGSHADTIIKEYVNYVNQYLPSLSRCPAFREESRKRKIVMRLNSLGLDKLSALLLRGARRKKSPRRELMDQDSLFEG